MIPIISVKTVKINDFKTDIVFTYADGSEVVKTAYNDEQILDYKNVLHKGCYCCDIENKNFNGFTGELSYKAMNYEYVQEDNQPDDLFKSAYIEMNYDFRGKSNIRTTFGEEGDTTADLFMPEEFRNDLIGTHRDMIGIRGRYAYIKGYNASINCVTVRRFDMVERALDGSYIINMNSNVAVTFRYGYLYFSYSTYAVSTLYKTSVSKLNRSSSYKTDITVKLHPEISYGFIDFVDTTTVLPDTRYYDAPNATHVILVPDINNVYSLKASVSYGVLGVSSILSDGDFMAYKPNFYDLRHNHYHTIATTGYIHTQTSDEDVLIRLPIKDYREYVEFKINPNEKDKLGHTQKFSDCKFVTSDGLNVIHTKTKRHELLSKYVVPALQATITNNFYRYGKYLPYPDNNGDAYYLINIDNRNEIIRVNYRNFDSCRPKCSLWGNKQPMDYYDDLIVDDDERYLRLATTTYTTINHDVIPLEGLEFFGYGELPTINKTVPLGVDLLINGRFIPSMMNNTVFLYYGEEEPITININRISVERNHIHTDSYHTATDASVKFSLGSIQLVFPELGIMASQYNCRFKLMDITKGRIVTTGNYTVGSTVNLTDDIVEYASSDEFTNRHIYDIELEVYNRNHYSVYSESIFQRTIHCYLSKDKLILPIFRVELPNFTYNVDYYVEIDGGEYEPSVGSSEAFIMIKKNTSKKNTIMRVYKDNVLIGDSGTSVVIPTNSTFVDNRDVIMLFKSEVGSMLEVLSLNADGLTYSFRLESFVVPMRDGIITENVFVLRDDDGNRINIPSTYLSIEDNGNTLVVTNLPKQWIEDNVLLGSSYYMFVVSREVIIGGKDSLYEGEYVYKVYP